MCAVSLVNNLAAGVRVIDVPAGPVLAVKGEGNTVVLVETGAITSWNIQLV